MKTKKRILNISLALLLILTLALTIAAVVQVEEESKMLHGSELLASAIALTAVLIISAVFSISEVSVYFNFRYFLLCEDKSRLKSVLNITALVMNICLLVCLRFALTATDFYGILYLLFWVLFIILRIFTFFAPNGNTCADDV